MGIESYITMSIRYAIQKWGVVVNKKTTMKALVIIMTAGYLTLLFLFTENLSKEDNQGSDVDIEQQVSIEEEETAKAPFPEGDFATPEFQILIIGLGVFMIFVGVYGFFIRKDESK